jgi:FlaA1/EpsC-like NDP-sugar epimerase
LRPGEKLVEELVAPTEDVRPTRFEKVSVIVPCALDVNRVSEDVANLLKTAQENDREGVYRVLSGMGLRFRSRDNEREWPPPSK